MFLGINTFWPSSTSTLLLLYYIIVTGIYTSCDQWRDVVSMWGLEEIVFTTEHYTAHIFFRLNIGNCRKFFVRYDDDARYGNDTYICLFLGKLDIHWMPKLENHQTQFFSRLAIQYPLHQIRAIISILSNAIVTHVAFPDDFRHVPRLQNMRCSAGAHVLPQNQVASSEDTRLECRNIWSWEKWALNGDCDHI